MNPSERELLEKLDNLVLTASGDELRKIQEIDIQTQLAGMSFYDAFVQSTSLANQSIKQESRESQ
ncbi:MAG: hypothetical protein COV65_06970 [Nitrosopumilales archaeon CG11_big_fil_rev_8_21_14_0_20_33_24]|nr:MAG: hypothetical protein COV65_06970 [Nitrosopumilales archaeon CG11_big_fil_rev_8_21_14_0_20_33_24]PIY88263.1 MAG: hypothetical protein COY74_09165 [Nitrosopumilales archaeon CG_4_10_14_0_8_um_filter_34_8]PJB97560.1 MAG: hypothetical protein CO079_06965 [Nitrosopumilales archaeon CG_4_9_14_0_8_um_filter_34_10]